jgi:hypothetical protein
LARRIVLTSERARDEALGRAGDLRDGSEGAVELVLATLSTISAIDAEVYEASMDEAREYLRCATASRNGSTSDAHLLALAWVTDSDLWTHDRDFAGTGWPTWSNHNLLASLA